MHQAEGILYAWKSLVCMSSKAPYIQISELPLRSPSSASSCLPWGLVLAGPTAGHALPPEPGVTASISHFNLN